MLTMPLGGVVIVKLGAVVAGMVADMIEVGTLADNGI